MSKQLKPFLKEIADELRKRQVSDIYDADKYPLMDGYYISSSNGAYNNNASCCATRNYIPCTKYRNMEIQISKTTTGGVAGLAFYDKNKAFLSGVQPNSTGIITATVPLEACFYRFTIRKEYKDTASVLVTTQLPNIAAPSFPIEIANTYNRGKEDAETLMWSMMFGFGERTNFIRCFNGCVFDGLSAPEWFIPTAPSYQMFYSYYGYELPLNIDLSKIKETSTTATAMTTYALYSWATRITYIYDMGLPVYPHYHSTFATCRALKKIEIIRVDENTTFTSTFGNCNALEEVTFEGTIGKSISFSASPLKVETMKHIIEHLKNFSETDPDNAGTQTVTFTSTCWEALEASGEAPGGGTWENYVVNKGWLK